MTQTEPRVRSRLHVNFVVNLIGAVLPIPVLVLTVPIYIRYLGDARYGVLSLIWVMIAYLSFLDLGLTPATINAMARIHLDDKRERARVLISAFAISMAMGLICGVLIYVIGLYLLSSGHNVPVELEGEVRNALPWIATVLPLVLISGSTIGVLEARENFLLANIMQVGGTVLSQVAPLICAVFFSPDLSVIIPTVALVRMFSLLVSLAAVYKIEGPIRLSDFELARARKLLRYGGWVTVSAFVIPFLNTLDQLAVGRMLGVATVPYYSVPINVISRTQILTAAISRALFPRLSSSNPAEAADLTSRTLIGTAILYGGICASGILLMDPLLTLWLGPTFAAKSNTAAVLLVSSTWISAISFASYWLLHSQQRPDLLAKLLFAELPPFAGALYLLVPTLGILGAALASILRAVLDLGGQLVLSGIARRCLPSIAPIAMLMVVATGVQLVVGDHWLLMATLVFCLWPLILVFLRWQDRPGFDLLVRTALKFIRRPSAA